jgi:hypothetical protein
LIRVCSGDPSKANQEKMRICLKARLPEKVWEADVLPLNYARAGGRIAKRGGRRQGRRGTATGWQKHRQMRPGSIEKCGSDQTINTVAGNFTLNTRAVKGWR